ncbi:hypothetical protein SEA_SHROOMS_56 [Arthrobacter phage Shrooms]|nr:hypothetical protein SEA_SHROOMS_56 [Arthrobacter phage Shrooms]
MHNQAIHLIKNSLTRYHHDVTRFQEQVTNWEIKLANSPDGLTQKLYDRAIRSLEKAQATVAELEGSLRTLQAAEPVHAVQASYGPGQRVRIMTGGWKDRVGTIKLIGDDGVLLVRVEDENGASVTQASFKPSSVRAY